MKAIQILLLTFFLTTFAVNDSSAINFKPGNYEIKNWIELPGGGSSKAEEQLQYLTENDIISIWGNESGCETLSRNITGDNLTFELKCNFSGIEGISGNFTFRGDSFEGTLFYKYSKGDEMKIGMRGKRVGDTPESKPLPTTAEKLNEIDKVLRNKWSTMISYLKQGNLDKALELFHPFKRKDQLLIFQALKSELPEIVAKQIEFNRIKINDEEGYAIYELVTKEKDGNYSYEVTFGKDPQNDVWYIMDF
jgi:hypothetical protein